MHARGAQSPRPTEANTRKDISSGEQVMELLMELAHKEGCAVIVITHDLEIASQMDEIYTVRDGELITE